MRERMLPRAASAPAPSEAHRPREAAETSEAPPPEERPSAPSSAAIESATSRSIGARLSTALLLALLMVMACGLAALGHNYTVGFGRADYSDEGSHYVTGLLIREYIAQGFPATPL